MDAERVMVPVPPITREPEPRIFPEIVTAPLLRSLRVPVLDKVAETFRAPPPTSVRVVNVSVPPPSETVVPNPLVTVTCVAVIPAAVTVDVAFVQKVALSLAEKVVVPPRAAFVVQFVELVSQAPVLVAQKRL